MTTVLSRSTTREFNSPPKSTPKSLADNFDALAGKCDARPTTSCNVCETVTPRLRVTVALLHALPTASTRRKACRLLASLLANTLCRQSAHNAIYRHGRVFCGSHPN
eukprot:8614315-Pyramimonas_sp.AAC.2